MARTKATRPAAGGTSTANIRSVHICSSARQGSNSRQWLKDPVFQDFSQHMLQRPISAIDSEDGHTLLSEARKRFGHFCTRSGRHMYDFRRILEDLPERGQGGGAGLKPAPAVTGPGNYGRDPVARKAVILGRAETATSGRGGGKGFRNETFVTPVPVRCMGSLVWLDWKVI